MGEEEQVRHPTVAPANRVYCGVDIGASATKVVVLDDKAEVRARIVRHSGVNYDATAKACLAQALAESGVAGDQVVRTVATGYGRRSVDFADASRTEIQCHGVGAYHLVPRAITVVDIGGQDNKVIHLDGAGRRHQFKMNRKCAAGTGAFIEEIALRLDVDLGEMDSLARSAREAVQLSSFCTVFAKTEILAHLRQGAALESIVRGAFLSVVQRVIEMDPLAGDVVMTGGVVAHNPSIAELLSGKLGREVVVPPYPQFTGALGAALIACQQAAGEDAPDFGDAAPAARMMPMKPRSKN